MINVMANRKMAVKKAKKKKPLPKLSVPRFGKAAIRIASVVAIIAVIGWAGFQGVSSYKNIWPIKKIAINAGLQHVDENEIKKLVSLQSNQGMWAIDLEQLKKSINALDWVKKIEVRKVWPDQLVFVIEEHVPVVLFTDQLLTQAGTRVKITNAEPWKLSLPAITIKNMESRTLQELKDVWMNFRNYRRQLELIDLKLTALSIDEINNWVLQFEQGLLVNLGRKNRDHRIERIVKVYGEIENKKEVAQIDSRYRNGFAVAWKDTQKDLKG